jgi:hypothetical protein
MHGVDAFFWWDGTFVTIDVSMMPKDTLGCLRADFVLTPKDLEPEALLAFGKKVAMLLKDRRPKRRGKRRSKKRHNKPIVLE